MNERTATNGIKNGKMIYDWIIRNHPPLTWNLLVVKIGDHFLENEIDPFYILNSTEFSPDLVQKIDEFLQEHRKTGLPGHLMGQDD